MVRRVDAVDRIVKHLARLKLKRASIENPVDISARRFSSEAMKGAGIRRCVGLSEVHPLFTIQLLADEPLITRAFRGCIKIAHDDGGSLSGKGGELSLNHPGRPHLGRALKIKVGVKTDQGPVMNMEEAKRPLPWKLASKGTTWDMGRLTEKKLDLLLARNATSVKKDIVLPEFWRRNPSSYIGVIGKVVRQEIDLKIIGLLGGNEIRMLALKQLEHTGFPTRPPIRAVVSKAKT